MVKPDLSFLLLLHIALYSSVNNLVHIKYLAQFSIQEIRYEKHSALIARKQSFSLKFTITMRLCRLLLPNKMAVLTSKPSKCVS